MKKLLVLLTLFLLMNVSLANPFSVGLTHSTPISTPEVDLEIMARNDFFEKFGNITTIIFIILFIFSMINIIVNNIKLIKNEYDDMVKKETKNKSIVFLLIPFVFLLCCYLIAYVIEWEELL